MNLSIWSIMIALNLYGSASSAAREPAKPPSIPLPLMPPLITPSSSVRDYRYMRRALLTSTEPGAPNLLPPLADLCLAYVPPVTPHPATMSTVATIKIPGAVNHWVTVTGNNRIIVIVFKIAPDHLEVYEIDKTTYEPLLLFETPIRMVMYDLAHYCIAVSNDVQYLVLYQDEPYPDHEREDVLVWNLYTNHRIKIIARVKNAIFNADNSQLFLATKEERLIVIHPETGSQLKREQFLWADCCDNIIGVVRGEKESNTCTALFFDVNKPEIPLHTITNFIYGTDPCSSGVGVFKCFTLAYPRTMWSETIYRSSCLPRVFACSCSITETITDECFSFNEDDTCSIKETPWGTYLLNRDNREWHLRIPNAKTAYCLPNNAILLYKKGTHRNLEIRIVKYVPELAAMLTQLDTQTACQLQHIVQRHNDNVTDNNLIMITSKEERIALDRLQKLSPTLYKNFVRWCRIV